MTALIVILCILAFLALLLHIPIVFYLSYEDSLKIKIRYLFFSYQVVPPKEKKKKAKKKQPAKQTEKKEENGKKSALRQILEQKGLSGFLTMLKQMAEVALGSAKKLLRHMVVKKLWLRLTVVGEDAADTAILYGGVCAVVYPALGALMAQTRCEKPDIQIEAGFQAPKTEIHFQVKAKLKLFFGVISVIWALSHYMQLVKKKTASAMEDK